MSARRAFQWGAAALAVVGLAFAAAACGGGGDDDETAATTAAAGTTATVAPTQDGDFAGTVDIGEGREMYMECRGSGSPTVVLVSGLDTAADLWNIPDQADPKVFPRIAESTRVCAYDRPGAPLAVGARAGATRCPSRPRQRLPSPTCTPS